MSRFSITLSPRISETDLVGHINNVSIAAWFEDLRVRYMRSLANDDDGENRPGNFTLASLTIDFVGETHYGTEVVLSILDVSLGNSSFTLNGELHQDGKLTARGKAVMVHWDVQTRRPQRIPDALRKHLAASGQ